MESEQAWEGQVAAKVRRTIKDRGLTEETVGLKAGVPNSTLSRCLNGHSPLNLTQIRRIAEVLGEHPTRLIDLTTEHVREAS